MEVLDRFNNSIRDALCIGFTIVSQIDDPIKQLSPVDAISIQALLFHLHVDLFLGLETFIQSDATISFFVYMFGCWIFFRIVISLMICSSIPRDLDFSMIFIAYFFCVAFSVASTTVANVPLELIGACVPAKLFTKSED